jgi:hypothetical protein
MLRWFVLLPLLVFPALSSTKLLVTVVEQKSGRPVTDLKAGKTLSGTPGPRIFEVLRAHYTLTVSGNLSLGEKLKVAVQRTGKLSVSALPLE